MEEINMHNGEVEEDMSLLRNLLTLTKPRICVLVFFSYVIISGYYMGLKEIMLIIGLPIFTMAYIMLCYISSYDHGTSQGRY